MSLVCGQQPDQVSFQLYGYQDMGTCGFADSNEAFDPAELVRYAESYGHPEEWIKKAQELHAKVERLEAELAQAHSFAIENFGAEG